MSKFIKYGGSAVAVIVILICSINIKKLDEVRAAVEANDFDAAAYAQSFWEQGLSASFERAITMDSLFAQLERNFDSTANTGQQVGISDHRYFMVVGTGTIIDILEDDVLVELEKSHRIRLATGFIFGNTVRNAAQQIEIGEFVNMTRFNQVSIEINKLVEKNIIPDIQDEAQVGKEIRFAGALSINVESRELDLLRVIPLRTDIGGN